MSDDQRTAARQSAPPPPPWTEEASEIGDVTGGAGDPGSVTGLSTTCYPLPAQRYLPSAASVWTLRDAL